MSLGIEEKDIEKFIMVADRLLVKPKVPQQKTKSGLYLPPGVQEKEKVQSGYVIKAGPGYPIPGITDEVEPWKNNNEQVKYIPLQAREGDMVVFLQGGSYEIQFNNEKYYIIPHSALLMILRDEGLFT